MNKTNHNHNTNEDTNTAATANGPRQTFATGTQNPNMNILHSQTADGSSRTRYAVEQMPNLSAGSGAFGPANAWSKATAENADTLEADIQRCRLISDLRRQIESGLATTRELMRKMNEALAKSALARSKFRFRKQPSYGAR